MDEFDIYHDDNEKLGTTSCTTSKYCLSPILKPVPHIPSPLDHSATHTFKINNHNKKEDSYSRRCSLPAPTGSHFCTPPPTTSAHHHQGSRSGSFPNKESQPIKSALSSKKSKKNTQEIEC